MAPRNNDTDFEGRLEQLETRMTRVEEKQDKMSDSINGSGDKLGVFEQLRRLNTSSENTQILLRQSCDKLDGLQADKWKLHGIVVAAVAASGVVAWIINLLWKS
jgi:hypothetical protein